MARQHGDHHVAEIVIPVAGHAEHEFVRVAGLEIGAERRRRCELVERGEALRIAQEDVEVTPESRVRRGAVLRFAHRRHAEQADLGSDERAAVGRQRLERAVVALELARAERVDLAVRLDLHVHRRRPAIDDVRRGRARDLAQAIELHDRGRALHGIRDADLLELERIVEPVRARV